MCECKEVVRRARDYVRSLNGPRAIEHERLISLAKAVASLAAREKEQDLAGELEPASPKS